MPMSVTYTNYNGRIVCENGGGVETFFMPDTLGNVIETRDMATGVKTSETTYWPFGEVRTQTGTNPSPWGFCGVWGYYSAPGQPMYVRARCLRADLGRWMTVDPLWPGEPAYGCAKNAPVEFADPSGLSPGACFQDCFKFLAGRGMSGFYACSYCKLRCQSGVDCSNYPSNPSLERSTECSKWWPENTAQARAGFEQICRIICAGLKGPAKQACVELCKTQGVGIRVHSKFGICDSRILEYRRWKGEQISCSDCCEEACGGVALCVRNCLGCCCCPTETQ